MSSRRAAVARARGTAAQSQALGRALTGADEVIRALYGATPRPVFTAPDGALSAAGRHLRRVIDEADARHAIHPERLGRARIDAHIKALDKKTSADDPRRAALELELTRALITLTRTLRTDHAVWRRGAEADRLLHHTLAPLFLGRRQLGALLEAIEPPHVQYRRLGEAHRAYLMRPDWAPVPRALVGLSQGQRHEQLPALAERLRAEGYLSDAAPGQALTPTLRSAIEDYQRHHQLQVTGALTEETWRSLNVPRARRLHQLRHSLRQWQRSAVGDETSYIHVNIPDFHAEAWHERERQLRLRVITGATRKSWLRGKATMPLATRLFSARVEAVELHPEWVVPLSIIRDEINPALKADPSYLTTHKMAWTTASDGRRRLRQAPGPHNALGKVKLLFPNPHDIYMHDTPEPGYFEYPIRAFSHGCIRVQRPMELARWVLQRSGQWDRQQISAWLDAGETRRISLETPTPIHIEYMVVRADARGQAHFLADIYQIEREAVAPDMARRAALDVTGRATALTAALSTP